MKPTPPIGVAGRPSVPGPRTNGSPGRKHRKLALRPADASLAALAADLHRLSGGSVRKISASGPVLAAHRPRRRLRRATFTPALDVRARVLIAVLSVCWAAGFADFWVWWLTPAHRTSLAGLAINSIILIYLTCYPVFFVIAVNRLRCVSRSVQVPMLRVAFVVTRAPAEPWDIARSTLYAMKNQDFPFRYRVWLCDESPTAGILDWCAAHQVTVATRESAAAGYHRDTWPRRTKCKEGNLAYFYDRWGYRDYDVVVQLDCDHRPSATYLTEMVRPFADPAVGYVAAPSICDANAASSWAARGRLYREAVFHGAFQLGHSDGWAPACIGSHYAVRTSALRDIDELPAQFRRLAWRVRDQCGGARRWA